MIVAFHILLSGVAERFQFFLGLRIKERRRAMRLTQAELAERVGMARAALAGIEIGRQRTSVIALARLARNLDTPPGALIPSLSEAEAQWDESRRTPLPERAPMLEKELREYNFSPEKTAGLEEALADVRAARASAGAFPGKRKERKTQP